jgi:serine/threonine-protein kinase
VAAGAFGVAWLFVAFIVFPDTGVAGVVTVPPVVGLPYDDAAKRLADSGLRASLGESRLSGEAPKSTVLSQTPAAGARVARGEKVSLDVSAGQERATVPVLEGKSRAEADAALHGAGLQVGQVTERPDDRARGTVLASQPSAGQVVPAATAVGLVISSGPAELTMPDVVGRSLTDARTTLEQLGLTVVQVSYDSTSTTRAGLIIVQIPGAGSPIQTGATVTLRVAGKP